MVSGMDGAPEQRTRVPRVGLGTGQSGRLEWASRCKIKREGKEKESGMAGFRPNRGLENSKGFPFSNLFTKIKLIWIQFKFEFSNDSGHKIKFNSTHQYKN
jgi:hypothetical protein